MKENVARVPYDLPRPALMPVEGLAPIIPIREVIQVEQEMPMSDIPSSEIRRMNITERDHFVAKHEFGHAYAAQHYGFYVEMLTTVPKPGVYEGVTRLKGPFTDARGYQVVSAAGAAAVGSRQGAGSDFAGIERIQNNHGGYTPDQALVHAEALLSTLSEEEKDIIAEIVAYKKTVYGYEIPAIIARARYEVGKGESVKDKAFKQQTERLIEYVNDNPDAPEIVITTHTETNSDGITITYQSINGSVDEGSREIYCSICKQVNRHLLDCKNNGVISQNGKFGFYGQVLQENVSSKILR